MAMKAAVFKGKNMISLDERPVPDAGPGEAVLRVSLTTICGTDVHIMNGKLVRIMPGTGHWIKRARHWKTTSQIPWTKKSALKCQGSSLSKKHKRP